MWNASKQGVFLADGSENTIAHLTGVKLRAHRFAFPPLAEQRAIAEQLDGSDTDINKAISATEREIALLHEYRTRLIADVVTGKLDVREAAARLPDEGDAGEEIGDDLLEGDEPLDDNELDTEAEEGEA